MTRKRAPLAPMDQLYSNKAKAQASQGVKAGPGAPNAWTTQARPKPPPAVPEATDENFPSLKAPPAKVPRRAMPEPSAPPAPREPIAATQSGPAVAAQPPPQESLALARPDPVRGSAMIARTTGPVALATAGSVELPRPLLDRGAPLIPFGEPFQVDVHPGNTWQGICGGGCGRVLKGNDSDFGSMVKYARAWWCPLCVAKKRAEFVTQYLTLETCATCRMVTMSALLWEGLGCKKSHSGLRRCPQNNRGECMHSFDPFDVRAGNMSLTDPLGVRLEVPYNAIPPYLYKAGCAPKGIDLTLLPRREDLHPHHLHLVESGINFDPWAEGAASRLRAFTDMRDCFCWKPHPGYIPCRQMPFPESPLTGAIADEMDVDWSRRNVSIDNDGVVRGSMTQVPPPELQPETLADGTALIIGPSGTPRGTTPSEPRCVEVTTGDTGERLPEPRRAIPPGPPALLDPPLSTRETAEAIEKAAHGRPTLNLDSWFTLFRHLSKEEADDLANSGRIDG